MKILFYINVLHNGGAERVISILANYFNKKGYQVVVVNSYPVENEYYLDKEIRHIYLNQSRVKGSFLARNIRQIIILRKIIKEFNPAFSISFMAEPNFRNIIATIGLKTKTILSVRNDPAREYYNFLLQYLSKFLFRLSDGIVFQTNDAMRFFSNKIHLKSKVIFNPVNDIFFTENEVINVIKSNKIISVGRLESQKNFELLINAFSKICNSSNLLLYIYGEGSERSKLQKLIDSLNLSNRVFLLGNVKDIVHCLKDARLFVLSSNYEGMPNALMEAITLGIPCISTDCPCGGPRELLDKRFLVPIDDVDSLSKIMEDVTSNEILLQNMSSSNKIKSRTFKIDYIGQEWIEFMNEILKRE